MIATIFLRSKIKIITGQLFLPLLFIRIYSQTDCVAVRVENSVTLRFQNKIYDFGTYQRFNLKFTFLMKSPQRRKASVEVRKLRFVFSHNSRLGMKYRKLQNQFLRLKGYMLVVFLK